MQQPNNDAQKDTKGDLELRGIWLLGPREVAAHSEWLYRIGNVLVRGISDLVGGKSVAIPRVPRRSGTHSFGFHLVGDVAQCLRYARNESGMAAEYADEVANAIATILGTRAMDLVDLGNFELRTVELPVPDIDWESLADRVVPQIILASKARRLLETKKPVPLPLAVALTGWTEGELTSFVDPESGKKIAHKKRKGVRYFDPQTFDSAVQSIEKLFFDHATYKPF